MVVQHNISAMNANRYFGINNSGLSKSLEKLSSGYAINRAGDNAAGLAVSEKMRAQISGLTQATKNAEDGISMIQTFEGALTETDSILQRMRTLAVQSANGTYQDDVDREAIQLEYDQLNDELNQIADTDFNGVVVLNGGEMADGLKAVNSDGDIISGNDGKAISGNFDYENKKGQLIDRAKAEADAALIEADKALTAAKDKFKSTPYDISANGAAQEWNTLDSNTYNKTEADAVWTALNIVDDKGEVDTSDITKVDITFTRKADGTWEATSGIDNNGHKIADVSGLTTAVSDAGAGASASGLGGFTVTGTSVNAIFDNKNAKAGDTVTITFRNDTEAKYAPDNIGFNEKSLTATGNLDKAADMKIELDTGLEDDAMNADVQAALKALEDVKVTGVYTAETGVGAGDNTLAISFEDADGNVSNITWNNANAQTITVNGVDIKATLNAAKGNELTLTAADGTDIGKITFKASDAATAGTISGNISISTSAFSESNNITATVGKDQTLGTSNAAKKELDAAQAAYDKAAAVSITDYESAKAYLDEKGVSVSDAFDQSTATLTYTNNITLQTGARTKDAVNFTFSYESNGLGELNADLDCSARGLGTDQLSLATQGEANNAIDKIDNAINKVSMVRASFGAMQNRLEHKIANLEVNNENLTAAESRIRDTDMAKEMTNFTKNQILSQASQAMLAQANQLPQGVLQLLG